MLVAVRDVTTTLVGSSWRLRVGARGRRPDHGRRRRLVTRGVECLDAELVRGAAREARDRGSRGRDRCSGRAVLLGVVAGDTDVVGRRVPCESHARPRCACDAEIGRRRRRSDVRRRRRRRGAGGGPNRPPRLREDRLVCGRVLDLEAEHVVGSTAKRGVHIAQVRGCRDDRRVEPHVVVVDSDVVRACPPAQSRSRPCHGTEREDRLRGTRGVGRSARRRRRRRARRRLDGPEGFGEHGRIPGSVDDLEPEDVLRVTAQVRVRVAGCGGVGDEAPVQEHVVVIHAHVVRACLPAQRSAVLGHGAETEDGLRRLRRIRRGSRRRGRRWGRRRGRGPRLAALDRPVDRIAEHGVRAVHAVRERARGRPLPVPP